MAKGLSVDVNLQWMKKSVVEIEYEETCAL